MYISERAIRLDNAVFHIVSVPPLQNAFQRLSFALPVVGMDYFFGAISSVWVKSLRLHFLWGTD
jgi:hypothetical protein